MRRYEGLKGCRRATLFCFEWPGLFQAWGRSSRSPERAVFRARASACPIAALPAIQAHPPHTSSCLEDGFDAGGYEMNVARPRLRRGSNPVCARKRGTALQLSGRLAFPRGHQAAGFDARGYEMNVVTPRLRRGSNPVCARKRGHMWHSRPRLCLQDA